MKNLQQNAAALKLFTSFDNATQNAIMNETETQTLDECVQYVKENYELPVLFTSKIAYEKYNSLLQECIDKLREFAGDKVIDLEDNGFEDMSGNDICGLDKEKVYTENNSLGYPLHEIDLLDAIKIIGDLEGNEISYIDIDTLFHYEKNDNE